MKFPGVDIDAVHGQERNVSQRTIIEINHDYLPEVAAALDELVKMLPYASANEVREHLSMSSGVRFLARRHHSYDMKVLIAQRPDTPLEYVQGEGWRKLDDSKPAHNEIHLSRDQRKGPSAHSFLTLYKGDFYEYRVVVPQFNIEDFISPTL